MENREHLFFALQVGFRDPDTPLNEKEHLLPVGLIFNDDVAGLIVAFLKLRRENVELLFRQCLEEDVKPQALPDCGIGQKAHGTKLNPLQCESQADISFDFPTIFCIFRHVGQLRNDLMDTVKPRRLQRGDLIGLVSPASRIVDTTKIDRAVRYIEGLGYRVIVGANATKMNTYLAGTDEERAADLHAMFEDRRVKAIFCIRGGYGTPRLLPLMRYRMIAGNPKILVGYSDITALQLAIWRKARLVTFHGPMAGVDMADPMDPFTEEHFWRSLTSRTRVGRMTIPDEQPHTLVPGKGTGRLLGGNLALIASIVGTSFQPDFRNAVLFLEDIGEDPYRVDRMLTQLRGSGILPKAHGVLVGQFTECVPRDTSSPSFTVDEILQEYTYGAGVPSLSGLPFGHNRRKMTLPVGIRVRVNATERWVEYLEGAVR